MPGEIKLQHVSQVLMHNPGNLPIPQYIASCLVDIPLNAIIPVVDVSDDETSVDAVDEEICSTEDPIGSIDVDDFPPVTTSSVTEAVFEDLRESSAAFVVTAAGGPAIDADVDARDKEGSESSAAAIWGEGSGIAHANCEIRRGPRDMSASDAIMGKAYS